MKADLAMFTVNYFFLNLYVCMYSLLYVGGNYIDKDTVNKSLHSYNRVIREKYVSPDHSVTVENEYVTQPSNVCK